MTDSFCYRSQSNAFSQQWWQGTSRLPQSLNPNQSDALLAKWMRCGLSSVAPQSRKKPKQPWMDRTTLDQVISESVWRRQLFKSATGDFESQEKVLVFVWRMGVAPLHVAGAHDTLLAQTCMVSVQVTLSSTCVRRIVKQARQQWLERHVASIAKAAHNGDLKPLFQFS